MKALVLTAPDGSALSFNPAQVVGWGDLAVDAAGVAVVGTGIFTVNATPVPVREGRQLVDRLWAEAMAAPEHFHAGQPIILSERPQKTPPQRPPRAPPLPE